MALCAPFFPVHDYLNLVGRFLGTDIINKTCQYAHYYEWYWKPLLKFERSVFPHWFAWLLSPVAILEYSLLPPWEIAGKFATFINPFAHSSEGMEGWNAVWWLIHKLGGAFIVYQFLMALRRKTKR